MITAILVNNAGSWNWLKNSTPFNVFINFSFYGYY